MTYKSKTQNLGQPAVVEERRFDQFGREIAGWGGNGHGRRVEGTGPRGGRGRIEGLVE